MIDLASLKTAVCVQVSEDVEEVVARLTGIAHATLDDNPHCSGGTPQRSEFSCCTLGSVVFFVFNNVAAS